MYNLHNFIAIVIGGGLTLFTYAMLVYNWSTSTHTAAKLLDTAFMARVWAASAIVAAVTIVIGLVYMVVDESIGDRYELWGFFFFTASWAPLAVRRYRYGALGAVVGTFVMNVVILVTLFVESSDTAWLWVWGAVHHLLLDTIIWGKDWLQEDL